MFLVIKLLFLDMHIDLSIYFLLFASEKPRQFQREIYSQNPLHDENIFQILLLVNQRYDA